MLSEFICCVCIMVSDNRTHNHITFLQILAAGHGWMSCQGQESLQEGGKDITLNTNAHSIINLER